MNEIPFSGWCIIKPLVWHSSRTNILWHTAPAQSPPPPASKSAPYERTTRQNRHLSCPCAKEGRKGGRGGREKGESGSRGGHCGTGRNQNLLLCWKPRFSTLFGFFYHLVQIIFHLNQTEKIVTTVYISISPVVSCLIHENKRGYFMFHLHTISGAFFL